MRLKFLPSFVKRKGRITKKQLLNLNYLPHYLVTNIDDVIADSHKYKKCILEIGFGNAENLISQALKNPDYLYVGSEVYMSGIGTLISNLKEQKIANVRIFPNDIRLLLYQESRAVFDYIFIICPDPWPKEKHHKRRLIDSNFLKMLNFISTPIGNLNDISLRAIEVIINSDHLYSEDTRNFKKLLNHINCKKKSKSFHEHNEEKLIGEILNLIKENKSVSIVTDAGTPAISDPGYKLIQQCIKKNIAFSLIPGPSSVISGLVMSGLPTNQFSFYGFIPRKKNDQEHFFNLVKNDSKTSIFFESPKRLKKSINNMQNIFEPSRRISICKEMTKFHENIIIDNLSNIMKTIEEKNISLKGEIVVVLEGNLVKNNNIEINKKVKNAFLEKLSASDAAKLISLITKKNKRDIYDYLIEK